MKLRDKRFLKFEAMMAVCAFVQFAFVTLAFSFLRQEWAFETSEELCWAITLFSPCMFAAPLAWKLWSGRRFGVLSFATYILTAVIWLPFQIVWSIIQDNSISDLNVADAFAAMTIYAFYLIFFLFPCLIIFRKFLHKGKGETAQGDETEIEDER